MPLATDHVGHALTFISPLLPLSPSLRPLEPLRLKPLTHRGQVAPCHIQCLRTSQALGPQHDHASHIGHDSRARPVVANDRARVLRGRARGGAVELHSEVTGVDRVDCGPRQRFEVGLLTRRAAEWSARASSNQPSGPRAGWTRPGEHPADPQPCSARSARSHGKRPSTRRAVGIRPPIQVVDTSPVSVQPPFDLVRSRRVGAALPPRVRHRPTTSFVAEGATALVTRQCIELTLQH